MSNNDLDNDLDIENFDDAGGFEDYSKKGSLADIWRNNPMVKIGVILAGFAIIVGGIILFGGGDTAVAPSQVSSGSMVHETPGTSEISKTMQEAIEDKNIENAEEALRTNQSAMPIPVDPPKGALPVAPEETSGEDPLERWRQMQEERIRQQEMLTQAKPQVQDAKPPPDTRTPAVNALSNAMASQIQAILQNQSIAKPMSKEITPPSFLETVQQKKQAVMVQQQQIAMASAQPPVEEAVENILLPAGTIEYGQLLMEANTDAPGPVMVQIMSGPLRGSRVLGSFQSTEEYLTLNFNMIVIDGLDYPVQAVAIDPNTTLPGVITEIDRRYLKRIILPMAAEFVSGLANAISESGTTSVFVSNNTVTQSTNPKDQKQEVASGITQAGEKLSEILNDEVSKTKPMLRVAGGTPVGILFVAPVSDAAPVQGN